MCNAVFDDDVAPTSNNIYIGSICESSHCSVRCSKFDGDDERRPVVEFTVYYIGSYAYSLLFYDLFTMSRRTLKNYIIQYAYLLYSAG